MIRDGERDEIVICVQRVVRVVRSVYACICNYEALEKSYEIIRKWWKLSICNRIYFYDTKQKSLEK